MRRQASVVPSNAQARGAFEAQAALELLSHVVSGCARRARGVCSTAGAAMFVQELGRIKDEITKDEKLSKAHPYSCFNQEATMGPAPQMRLRAEA